jgi:hypothetical protein
MGHGAGDLGGLERPVHEFGFSAVDGGIDVLLGHNSVRSESLLSLVDDRNGCEENYCDANIGNQDKRKSLAG